MDEAQIAGAQPAHAVIVGDEGIGRGGGVLPVAGRHARPAGPDFPHPVGSGHLPCPGIDDPDGMAGGSLAAGHQGHAIPFGQNLPPGQRRFREGHGVHAMAGRYPGHHQRAFGQSVARIDGPGGKPAAPEPVHEGLHRVGPDGLGTGVGNAPARQVQPVTLGLADAVDAQAIGKVGTTTDRDPMLADQPQPAHRAGREMVGAAQHTRNTTVEGLKQPADQPHVVKERRPHGKAVGRGDGHQRTNGRFVGHQAGVRDHHTLGVRGGTGGVLQEGRVRQDRLVFHPLAGQGRIGTVDLDEPGNAQRRQNGGDERRQRSRGEHEPRLCIGRNAGQTGHVLRAGGFRREHRHGNDAGGKTGKETHHIVLVIVEQQQGPLARHGLALQCGRQRTHLRPERGIAEDLLAGLRAGGLRHHRQRHGVAMVLCQSCQALHEVPGRHESILRGLKLSSCHFLRYPSTYRHVVVASTTGRHETLPDTGATQRPHRHHAPGRCLDVHGFIRPRALFAWGAQDRAAGPQNPQWLQSGWMDESRLRRCASTLASSCHMKK